MKRLLILLAIIPAALQAQKKLCFENGGLRYHTAITITYITPKSVLISIKNDQYSDEVEDSLSLKGKVTGDKIVITWPKRSFAMGDHSELHKRPWTLKSKKLLVPVSGKNYETNKWEISNSDFTPCGVKS